MKNIKGFQSVDDLAICRGNTVTGTGID